MELWIIWLIIIATLLTLEVIFQSVWALCLAMGSLAGVILAVFGASLAWQIGLSALGSVVAYIIMIPYFQRFFAKATERRGKSVRTGMDALLGRKGVLSQQITPDNFGRLRIDGDNWQVRSSKNSHIPRGTEVVVTGYDSIILTVEPLSE